MFLSDINEGGYAVICRLNLDNDFKIRLRDLGFCENERVRCIRGAMMKSPILFRVKGSSIALRKADADRIEVCADE